MNSGCIYIIIYERSMRVPSWSLQQTTGTTGRACSGSILLSGGGTRESAWILSTDTMLVFYNGTCYLQRKYKRTVSFNALSLLGCRIADVNLFLSTNRVFAKKSRRVKAPNSDELFHQNSADWRDGINNPGERLRHILNPVDGINSCNAIIKSQSRQER